jgi:hypothetical protein
MRRPTQIWNGNLAVKPGREQGDAVGTIARFRPSSVVLAGEQLHQLLLTPRLNRSQNSVAATSALLSGSGVGSLESGCNVCLAPRCIYVLSARERAMTAGSQRKVVPMTLKDWIGVVSAVLGLIPIWFRYGNKLVEGIVKILNAIPPFTFAFRVAPPEKPRRRKPPKSAR